AVTLDGGIDGVTEVGVVVGTSTTDFTGFPVSSGTEHPSGFGTGFGGEVLELLPVAGAEVLEATGEGPVGFASTPSTGGVGAVVIGVVGVDTVSEGDREVP